MKECPHPEFDFHNDSDLDYEIHELIDGYQYELDEIFEECERKIRGAFYQVKKVIRDERADRCKKLERKILQSAIKCLFDRSEDYTKICIHILHNVYDGYIEGFPYQLESQFHDDRAIIIMNATMVLQDADTMQALKILRSQHCQMFR